MSGVMVTGLLLKMKKAAHRTAGARFYRRGDKGVNTGGFANRFASFTELEIDDMVVRQVIGGSSMNMSKILTAAAFVMPFAFLAAPAHAQDNYLGQVILIGGTFCPQGTLEANGQVVGVQGSAALFSLYGTTYGGNGQTTFGLPKLAPPVPGMRYCVVADGIYPMRP